MTIQRAITTRRAALAAMLVLWLAAPAVAQTVQPDRVTIGPEWVPRDLTAGAVLAVPVGQIATLPATSTWDYVEVAGTLRCARTGTTVVRFTTLIVLPGGVFDCGTPADPVTGRVELIVRDVPIDTARDPFQWGHGIINFGQQTRVGPPQTAFVEAAGDLLTGATTIMLAQPLTGAAVGDGLYLPDTRQMPLNAPDRNVNHKAQPESTTIAAISADGLTVTLATPLASDHLAQRDPDGGIWVRPRVVDVTRAHVMVRSENPSGTRGHTVNVGHEASWDVEFNTFLDLGRTQAIPLDNTTADASGAITHVGTNQIAKYASHDHHAGSMPDMERRLVGNVWFQGAGAKWCHSIHGTSDVLVQDNVCLAPQGAGFVTEDGNEVRNQIRHNLTASAVILNTDPTNDDALTKAGCPGCAGTGFWFRGGKNVIEANEAWNNVRGLDLFNMLTTGSYASTPGGPVDTPVTQLAMAPIAFTGNVVASNAVTGITYWFVPRFQAIGNIASDNALRQLWANLGGEIWWTDSVLLDANGQSTAIEAGSGYITSVTMERTQVRGCDQAITPGVAIRFGLFRDVTFQCRTDVTTLGLAFPRQGIEVIEPTFLPFASEPHRYLGFTSGEVWTGTGSPISTAAYLYNAQESSLFRVTVSGASYRILHPQQQAALPSWVATDASRKYYAPPVCGTTQGETYQRCSIAWGGYAYQPTEPAAFDGVFNAVAIPDPLAYGPGRAVLTLPNTFAPVPEGTTVPFDFLLTGSPVGLTQDVWYAIDGGAEKKAGGFDSNYPNKRLGSGPATAGTHTVTSYRKTVGGTAANAVTFQYVVGTGTPPPPAPGDCAMSSWTIAVISGGAFDGWQGTSLIQRTQPLTITWSRTIVTPPTNGGAPCGDTSATTTTTGTETASPVPPPQ